MLAAVLSCLAVPAGASSQAADRDPRPDPERPGLVLDVSEERYAIAAATFPDLVEALNGMRLQGPGGPLSQGLTQYRIVPEWTLAAAGGACRVSGVRVRARVVVTLPEWTAAADASDDELERWEAIEERIRDHEHRHRDLTIEAAEGLLDRLRGLTARGCAQLRRAVEAELAIADRRLAERHAELDANP